MVRSTEVMILVMTLLVLSGCASGGDQSAETVRSDQVEVDGAGEGAASKYASGDGAFGATSSASIVLDNVVDIEAASSACLSRGAMSLVKIEGSSDGAGDVSAVVSVSENSVFSLILTTETTVDGQPAIYRTSDLLDGSATVDFAYDDGTFVVSGIVSGTDAAGRDLPPTDIHLAGSCQ